MTAAPGRVFAALDRATPDLLTKLRHHGISRIEYVVGFVKPYGIHVWLCTATDGERDALPAPNPCQSEVRAVLDAAGLPRDEATFEGTVAQSQETVDRDYEGSWFYALR